MSADRIGTLLAERATLRQELVTTAHQAGANSSWHHFANLWRRWNTNARVRLMVIDLELKAYGVEP